MEREILIALYDIYKNLLTTKQKGYFEQYYFYDLSFAEIADNFTVSRNAVFDQLKKTKELLVDYEEKLGLNGLYEKLEDTLSIDNLDDIKKQIKDIIKE